MRERLKWLAKGETGASAVAQTIVAKGGMLFVNLLTGVVVARTLLAHGRGEMAAIALWPTLFGNFFGLGINLAVIYNIKKDPGHQRNYFSTALVAMTLLGGVAAIVGAIVLPHTLAKYPPDVIRSAQWLMVFSVQVLVQYMLQATLEARGRFDLSNQLRYVPLLLTLAGLVALAALHGLTPLRAVLCYNLPAAVLTLATLFALRDYFPLRLERWRVDLKTLLSFGLRSYGNDLVNTFSWQIEQGLIVALLSPENLGYFAVATNVSRMLGVVHSSFVIVVMPKAAGIADKDEVVELAARAARISSSITGIVAIALAATIPFVMPLAYGHSFGRAVIVAQLLMLDVLMQGIVAVLSQAFVALGRPASTTIFQIAGIAISAPMLLFLVPRYGVVGAAIAFVIASSIRLTCAIASYPLLLHHRIPRLVLTSTDIAFVRRRLRIGKTAVADT